MSVGQFTASRIRRHLEEQCLDVVSLVEDGYPWSDARENRIQAGPLPAVERIGPA
ncbi:hypothetical protein D9M69_692970 [compost metagenome]